MFLGSPFVCVRGAGRSVWLVGMSSRARGNSEPPQRNKLKTRLERPDENDDKNDDDNTGIDRPDQENNCDDNSDVSATTDTETDAGTTMDATNVLRGNTAPRVYRAAPGEAVPLWWITTNDGPAVWVGTNAPIEPPELMRPDTDDEAAGEDEAEKLSTDG